MMAQPISLSISELLRLLKEKSLTRDSLTITVSSQRLVCRVGGCPWQGTDNSKLDSHVRVSHNDTSYHPGNEVREVIFLDDEVQQLAMRGDEVIGGIRFQVAQPVRFLLTEDGGKWFTQGREHIYDKEIRLTAREVQITQQLRDAERKHIEEVAEKDERIKTLEENRKVDQTKIEGLEDELKEAKNSLVNVQIFCDKLNASIEDLEIQKAGTDVACDALRDVISKLDASNATLQTQLRSVDEVMGKSVLTWAEEYRKDQRTIESQNKQISALKLEINQASVIVKDAIAIHRRFFVYAKEGMINRSVTPYHRSPEVAAIVKTGNDVAHRANIRAHIVLYEGGKLYPDDITTFENIYGVHPDNWSTSLISPKSVEMWNMMGTVAATLARIKFSHSSYSRYYKEFLGLCEATTKIRKSIEKEKGITEDGAKAFDAHADVSSNLGKMQRLVDMFTRQDKTERSGIED